jgi:hypothetical protein
MENQIEELQAASTEPAAKSARQMFKYSEFVDIGEGCERESCEDIEHFHAWCRLPNQYQRDDIRKKGMAAKARKIREMNDPESDAATVLDTELQRIEDPMFAGQLIEEMVAREWAEDYIEAQTDVSEREEFEHIEQDREEHARLKAAHDDVPEDEWSEEYKASLKHMSAFVDALRTRLEEIQEPKRQELRDRSPADLVKLVRQRRVEEVADAAFFETYHAWMWFVGTFRVELHPTLGRPHIPMWEEIGTPDRPAAGTMFSEAPEVIEALRHTFNELSLALQKGSAGN